MPIKSVSNSRAGNLRRRWKLRRYLRCDDFWAQVGTQGDTVG